jgi:hypothetical protein
MLLPFEISRFPWKICDPVLTADFESSDRATAGEEMNARSAAVHALRSW